MKILVLTFIIIWIAESGFSQTDFRRGYVITNERDTLDGLVDYRVGSGAYQFCEFQKANASEKVRYGPSDIVGYGYLSDKTFESREIRTKEEPSKTVFIEVLVKGLVSLYKWNDTFYVDKTGQLLQQLTNESKERIVDGKSVVIYSNQYVGTLNMLLFDCDRLKRRIETVELYERSLTNLVQDYNKCKGAPNVTPKSDKPWVKASWGIAGGVNLSELDFQANSTNLPKFTGTSETSMSPVLGVSMDIFSPRNNERISFHADVLYAAPKYHLFNSTNNNAPTTTIDNIDIGLQQLKVPVGVRFLFREKGLAPYVNLGFQLSFNLSATSTWKHEIKLNNSVLSTSYWELSINRSQFGYWGGLGAMVPVSKGLSGFLEFRYERANGLSDTDFTSKVVSMQIIAGMKFR
jgi:opacity protein-like surface antigen